MLLVSRSVLVVRLALLKKNSLKLRLETDIKTTIHVQTAANDKATTRIGMISIIQITTVSHESASKKINDFG